MSNTEVIVLITILLTSLVAFFLLYRAKELNLGILFSISIGSIILGLTFKLIFNSVMMIINNNISLNKNIALIISILTVMFVFLIFILIISFIISFCIPKKVASIDCCVFIDSIIARFNVKKVQSKNNIHSIHKLTKNVYGLTNKLKKPVDTVEKIDTMGIEKVADSNLKEKSMGEIAAPDSVVFANLIGFMEPSEVVDTSIQASSTREGEEQKIESSDIDYASLAAAAYQEIASTQLPIEEEDIPEDAIPKDTIPEDVIKEELTESIYNDVTEKSMDDEIIHSTYDDIVESTTEAEVIENTYDDIAESTTEAEVIENTFDDVTENTTEVEVKLDEIKVPQNELVETDVVESQALENKMAEIDSNSLVFKAFDYKDVGKKEEAIQCYLEALQHEPNNEMIFWIVLDVCALYKQLERTDLAIIILEGLVSQYGAAIQPEVKKEIMNYIK